MSELTPELGPVTEAVVTDSVRITRPDRDEVRRITVRIDDPAFRYAAGQTIGVVVPGPHPLGNPYHTRRYSIASGRRGDGDGAAELELLVRRCFYVDDVSGESYPGIASNYLCDALPGQVLTITGPYRSPFRVPADDRSNLLMIGTGTGVAPFRGLIQAIYREHGEWRGLVRLYYGARNGMDLLYENDEQDDLVNYYDKASFEAFRHILTRPLASEADMLEATIADHAREVWGLMQAPATYVYLAGLGKVAERFDKVMEGVAPSPVAWREARERLREQGRWSELVYN